MKTENKDWLAMPTFCLVGGLLAVLPTIKTERLILRNISVEDAYDMFEYAKSPLVGPTAGWRPHHSVYETKAIIMAFLKSQNEGEPGVWSICLKTTGKMIGTIELYNYTYQFMAELGYSLSPYYWGLGLAAEASKAVLSYGFNTLKLKRIEAGTFETNYQSIRVCEKIGMKKEGILRNSYQRYDGKIFNKLIYSITDTDYFKK